MNVRRLLLSIAAFAITSVSLAQNPLWSDAEASSVKSYTDSKKSILPQNFRLIKLNRLQASQVQRQALQAGVSQLPVNTSAAFDLPLPDGKNIAANLFDSPLLSEELQKAYPGIKTYQLINPKNKNIVARLTISNLGVSGIIFTDNGTAYINPLGADYPDVHMVYYVKDLKVTTAVACAVKEDLSNLRPMEALAGDGKKRTFRLAVAATGEYTTWAGSQANALTYITTTVNNISAIYERDATITFTLVSNNSVLFTNAGTDPYATTSSPDATTLTTNHSTLVTNIGSANFDLGMVFNNGWSGGLAGLSIVCNATNKGRGAAGITFGTGANPTPGPQGPVFDGTVAHEIGHEFSATHSFAADNGFCAGNTTAATAYEPGGGSTLMAYAGSCTGNSYQNNSDLYFHAGNIAQIQSYVTGGSASCSTPVVISNHQPTVTVPAVSWTIPASTPFTLNSTGADVDGNTLKYTWEQMDAGLVTSTTPQSTNTSGPNFRPYPPSVNSSRTFPSIADIIANNSPVYEVLSSVTRTMNFRVTVRDEAAGGGGTGEADVAVNVNATAGPFIVTSQSTATTWTANGSNAATITWNVANTTAAPVGCSAVDILFSTDGGLTYPYTLLANTPNDGTQTITIPNLNTSIGRIKVQSRNNIFFNINAADIVISSSCSAEGTTFTPSSSVTGASGNALLNLTLNPVYGSVVTTSGQIVAGDPASNLVVVDSVSGAPHSFSNVFRYDTYTFTVNVAGTYTFTRSGAFPIVVNLYAQTFNPASATSNFITSNGLYGNVTTNVYLNNSITASLTPGRYYTLAVGSFSVSQPTLPASYVITVSAPSSGNLYSGPIDPGGSFNYTYVIVDNATGLIKAFDASSDLSNSGTYPSGTFTVYGLSYSNSISPATLSAYVGGPFSTLSNDLLYNPSTVCGNLSKNALTATVTATLPAALLPLNAYKTGSVVLLKWATASEQNNSYFDVQRSADGISFSSLPGKVTAKGNSTILTDYSYTDAAPATSWNYYRVKQVDLDGKSSFTNIARVNFADKNSSAIIYPNPVKSILHVDYYTEKPGQVKCVIIDGKGAVVRQTNLTVQSGRNLQQLNVSGLASGTYILRTISNNDVLNSKFIKE